MTIRHHDHLIQGSDDWLAARCGLLTASEFSSILTPTLKIADNPKSRAHCWEIAAQRITGYVEPHYISDAMLRGHEDEILAREAYARHFAKVREEHMVDEDCVCRLDFPEYLGDIGETLRSKLRMTYTVDGKELARFTEDQLLRDDQGNVLCAKSDLHWSLAEMVHKKPREILNKKRDRGAAKVGKSCPFSR
jgi:hypothetical protein